MATKQIMFFNPSKIIPYVNLWAEVLKQAIEDLNEGDKSEKYWAGLWFRSEDTELPAFIGVCEILNLNHGLVRAKLKEPIMFKEVQATQICIYCKKKRIAIYMKFLPLDGGYVCKRCDKELSGFLHVKKEKSESWAGTKFSYGKEKGV